MFISGWLWLISLCQVDSIWIESEQSVELSLETKGLDLKHRISELSGIPLSVLKPIANGKVIEDDISLLDQQIKVVTLCMGFNQS